MPKKTIKGVVTSDKMNKTVVVSVDVALKHKIYKKTIIETKRYKAHNDLGVKTGDFVQIEECPPYSKTVVWKVVQKLPESHKK